MPRKRGSNAERTKQLLLDAATQEFAANGYDRASLRVICSRAGVTTGALYFFFKSKEELFEQVVAPFTQPVLEIAEKNHEFSDKFLEKEGDGLEGGRASTAVLEICYDYPQIVKIISSNGLNAVVENFTSKLKDTIAARLAETLPDCGATKDGIPHAALTAQWLAGLHIDGLFKIVGMGLVKEDAERQLDAMMNILHEGLDTLVGR